MDWREAECMLIEAAGLRFASMPRSEPGGDHQPGSLSFPAADTLVSAGCHRPAVRRLEPGGRYTGPFARLAFRLPMHDRVESAIAAVHWAARRSAPGGASAPPPLGSSSSGRLQARHGGADAGQEQVGFTDPAGRDELGGAPEVEADHDERGRRLQRDHPEVRAVRARTLARVASSADWDQSQPSTVVVW